VIIAEDYDDMKSLKLFIRFLHFFDCSNEYNFNCKQDIFIL